ncbi:MAG TPA: DUF559 domain-containing protein [Thermoanaerobaculia bacterium]|nr:DUF559 domain-containing protein [Thermoanaerobaculia bacterium]
MREDRRTLSAFARELRHRQTDAEAVLWRRLRNSRLGVRFRRQHAVGRFILDFYCAEARLAIELDGGGHAEVGQEHYDRWRTERLQQHDVQVLRFWNTDVLQNIEGVMEAIWRELERRR